MVAPASLSNGLATSGQPVRTQGPRTILKPYLNSVFRLVPGPETLRSGGSTSDLEPGPSDLVGRPSDLEARDLPSPGSDQLKPYLNRVRTPSEGGDRFWTPFELEPLQKWGPKGVN